jgi:hypothetical protein
MFSAVKLASNWRAAAAVDQDSAPQTTSPWPGPAHTHAGLHLIGHFLRGQLAVQEHGVTRQPVGCDHAWLDLGLTQRPDPLIPVWDRQA